MGILRTFENDLLNYFPETEYIYELLDEQLEYVSETVKNMIVITKDLIKLTKDKKQSKKKQDKS